MIDKIKTICELSQVEIDEQKINLLIRYAGLLIETNQTINLISRKDEDHLFDNHIAPSMTYFLLSLFQDSDERIVDIGSGGGLPGIINAILFPRIKFTLIDSTQKKVKALTHFIEALKLKNCMAIWGRVEDVAFKKEHRAQYDICTSRGLASLGKLIPWSLPFLNKEGCILALKGGDLSEEITSIKKRSRYEILEYEFDEQFHYMERFKTLKLVEINRRKDEA